MKTTNIVCMVLESKYLSCFSISKFFSNSTKIKSDLFRKSTNQPEKLDFQGEVQLMMGNSINWKWTPEKHKYENLIFKKRILYLLLYLKRKQRIWSVKIPKFVLFEIIKLVKHL